MFLSGFEKIKKKNNDFSKVSTQLDAIYFISPSRILIAYTKKNIVKPMDSSFRLESENYNHLSQ